METKKLPKNCFHFIFKGQHLLLNAESIKRRKTNDRHGLQYYICNLAVINKMSLDPWLCVPSFRWVC